MELSSLFHLSPTTWQNHVTYQHQDCPLNHSQLPPRCMKYVCNLVIRRGRVTATFPSVKWLELKYMRWYFIRSNSQCFRRNMECVRTVQPMRGFTFLQPCDWCVIGCGAAPLGNWLTTFCSIVVASSSKSTNLRYTDLWIRDQYCFRIVRIQWTCSAEFYPRRTNKSPTRFCSRRDFKLCEINPLCHQYIKEIFPQNLRQYLGLIWVHVNTTWIIKTLISHGALY